MQNWPMANFADDTTPYTGGKNTQDVKASLKNCALVLFKRFENNFMKVKNHLLLSTWTSSTGNNGDINE